MLEPRIRRVSRAYFFFLVVFLVVFLDDFLAAFFAMELSSPPFLQPNVRLGNFSVNVFLLSRNFFYLTHLRADDVPCCSALVTRHNSDHSMYSFRTRHSRSPSAGE